MTNLEATKAEIAPFTADNLTIEKQMIDAGLSASDNYSSSAKTDIAKISVNILLSFLSLASESEGSFSQSYDKEGLKTKIDNICSANNLPVPTSSSAIRDRSNMW